MPPTPPLAPSFAARTPLFLLFLLASVWSFPFARAQPMPVTFAATLSVDGNASDVASAASGEVVAVLTGNRLVVTGSYRDLSGAITGANVRTGFPGEVGPPMRLQAEQAVLNHGRFVSMWTSGGTSGSFSGVFDLTDEQIATLAAGGAYVQVYSEAHPGGELRTQLETDLVVDPTAEDLVGIWRDLDNGDLWQIYEDGTWTNLARLADAGAAGTGEWRMDGGIVTWDLLSGPCAGRYVHREVLYRDGHRRWLTLEVGPCASAGVWRDLVKIDEEGNRVALR